MGNAREESALNMFRQMDLKGKTKDDTQLKTTHQNTISTIRAYDESDGALRQFSSKYPSALRFNIANEVQPVVSMAGSLFGMPRHIGQCRCSLIALVCTIRYLQWNQPRALHTTNTYWGFLNWTSDCFLWFL